MTNKIEITIVFTDDKGNETWTKRFIQSVDGIPEGLTPEGFTAQVDEVLDNTFESYTLPGTSDY
jgi:hypothetical protein